VAHIEPAVIQGLLAEVEKLENTMTTGLPPVGDEFRRAKIDEARTAIINGAAHFDAARWSQLSKQKQQELQEELMTMRDMLMDMTRNVDDKNRRSFSEGDTASSKTILWLAIFGLIFVATLLSLIR
jgi:hypothetical protein